MVERRKTREVLVGNVKVGGNSPITVQSMCNTKTADVKSTVSQILALESEGCEIIRVAVPDMESAKALGDIKKDINIPLVADIHFDYRIALESAKHVDKLRINPGNIGDETKTKAVIDAAIDREIPIRIGINLGSLEKDILFQMGATHKAMVESAMRHIKILEDNEFYNTIVSLKASDVPRTVKAYELLAEKCDYPLHIGVTEAGTAFSGTIKSSVGLGVLLSEGLGDTLRVSLTADPIEEIRVGKDILASLGIRQFGRKFVSCPTCGRTQVDIISLAKKVEVATRIVKKPITIAVMGCVVNGPGEAKDADVAVVGGNKCLALYKKGKFIRNIPEKEVTKELLDEIDKI